MKSWAQIITTPTADTAGTTIYLHFDNKRYVIGCLSEGIQRACVERGTRLARIGEYFITGRTDWDNNGGLLGMMLTVADVLANSKAEDAKNKAAKNKKGDDDSPPNSLNIVSAPNLNYHVATGRRFIFRKGMPLQIREVDHKMPISTEPYWQDDNIKVWALPIMPTSGRPVNPRKRSFEMLQDDEAVPDALDGDDMSTIMLERTRRRSSSIDAATEEQRRKTAKNIVDEMFNSNWKPDTLYETRLADVNMPAAIFIRNKDTGKIEKYEGPTPDKSSPLPDPDIEVLVRKPWPGALRGNLPSLKPAHEALSYIIRNYPQRGTFFPEKAKALGIKPGKNFALLTQGQSVTNEAGDTVTPEQVLGPGRPGSGFAVISLPDEQYIDELISRAEWQNDDIMTGTDVFFWCCGEGVVHNPRLQKFMQSFPNANHIISTTEHCANYPTFASSAASNARLTAVDNKRFSHLVHDDGTVRDLAIEGVKTTTAEIGLRVDLAPTVGVSRENVVKKFDIEDILERTLSRTVRRRASEARSDVKAIKAELDAWASTIPGRDVQITTLGTGSALPSKYRNVSSTLLRVPGWGALLFDAGENTMAQLRRVFAPAELKDVISSLKAIVISHMHADHHLGTTSVIKAWYNEVHKARAPRTSLPWDLRERFKQRRLAILAEPAMQHWIREYAQIEDIGYSRLAPIVLFTRSPGSQTSMMKWFYNDDDLNGDGPRPNTGIVTPDMLGLADVQAVRVNHCHGARAVSITWPDKFKASYSGDCRPSKDFAEIGRGSTVCIHEATFDDELQGDANAKQHCTTSEALGIAQAMGAKTCILTHFSQRYQKIPIIERTEEVVEDAPPAAAAQAAQGSAGVNVANGEGKYTPISQDQPPAADNTDATTTYTPLFHDDATIDDSKFRLIREGDKSVKLKSNMKVGVAFDYMTVKVGEIGELQCYTPALLSLFADEMKLSQEEDAKTETPQTTVGNGAKKRGQRRN